MRKLFLIKIFFVVIFLHSLTIVIASKNQKVIYEGSMKNEVYDAEYEIVSDKLATQFIATEKKIEIYAKNSLIKSIILHNKLGYKVRVNVSSDRKYFAVSQTVASDGKAAKLRKYEVYNYNGDLVWEKQTDHFLFFNECFSSYKKGTYYFYHPDIPGIGILGKDLDKFIKTKWPIKKIMINDNKLLAISNISSNGANSQISIILFDLDVNFVWEETYNISNTYEPIIKMYDKNYLFAYQYNGSNFFVIKNYKNELEFNYCTNSNGDIFNGEIDKTHSFLTTGNLLVKYNLLINKTEGELKLSGRIEYIKKINNNIFLWQVKSNKYYLSLINEDLNEIWTEEINLPLYEVGPPKDIKLVGKYIVLIFSTRILALER